VVAAFDVDRYDAFVFDLDGTVWLGTDPIPGAVDFLRRCRDAGKRIAYATNAIVLSPAELSGKLVACGIAHPDEPVVTGGVVMARTVAASGASTVAAVVPPALEAQLVEAGMQIVDPYEITVSSWGAPAADRALCMAASRQATIGAIERIGRLAHAGHRMYLSSRDPGFPVVEGIEPGGGVLLAAAHTMYDFEPIVVGKPSQFYADVVAESIGGFDQSIVMFGDSQRADIGIAEHLGADSVLLTGHSVRPLDRELPTPTFTAATLAAPPTPFTWPTSEIPEDR
jgi:HAD superfamily hydrolase (TIGR01450 family)